MTRRAAIVGSGPSGFYAAGQLLAKGWEVDLLDALPTPFGLVRAGVAPDHPKIKAVTRVFAKTAKQPGFRFFGGVELGRDIVAADLVERYHAVLYAFGTAHDNKLGIPGEDLPGSHPATEFVAWYNGHPGYCDHRYDLSVDHAVVIGNGNVAIDVARMLVLAPHELAPTDTADHAIEDLAASSVDDVTIVGRRGPAQAAFTNPELLELAELSQADVVIDPRDLELDPASAAWLASPDAHATNRRNVEILGDLAKTGITGKPKRLTLAFLWSPVAAEGDGRVEQVRLVRNRIEADDTGRLRAVATGEERVLPCGLLIRSIGYRGQPLPGIPFDERRGTIRNEGGRVTAEDGTPRPGEYATGWIKRGPSGVIGTNKKDSADTVAKVLEDEAAGRLDQHHLHTPDADEAEGFLRERVPELVAWDGWERIDALETSAGEPHGRPRVKLVRHAELADAARAKAEQAS